MLLSFQRPPSLYRKGFLLRRPTGPQRPWTRQGRPASIALGSTDRQHVATCSALEPRHTARSSLADRACARGPVSSRRAQAAKAPLADLQDLPVGALDRDVVLAGLQLGLAERDARPGRSAGAPLSATGRTARPSPPAGGSMPPSLSNVASSISSGASCATNTRSKCALGAVRVLRRIQPARRCSRASARLASRGGHAVSAAGARGPVEQQSRGTRRSPRRGSLIVLPYISWARRSRRSGCPATWTSCARRRCRRGSASS